MNSQPSVEHTSTDDAPLSEEQMAVYRSRLATGYYRSPEVLKHISERLTDDIYPPQVD